MMFQRIKRSLGVRDPGTARPVTAGYEALDSGDNEDASGGRIAPIALGGDGQMYWSFWALGAGVLLSWNGMFYSVIGDR